MGGEHSDAVPFWQFHVHMGDWRVHQSNNAQWLVSNSSCASRWTNAVGDGCILQRPRKLFNQHNNVAFKRASRVAKHCGRNERHAHRDHFDVPVGCKRSDVVSFRQLNVHVGDRRIHKSGDFEWLVGNAASARNWANAVGDGCVLQRPRQFRHQRDRLAFERTSCSF